MIETRAKGVIVELRELVAGEVEGVEIDTSVSKAVQKMHDSSVGALAVLEDDEVVGIFTERDLVSVIAAAGDVDTDVVGTWMTPYPDMLDGDTDVEEAADWMLAAGYRHIPVIDRGGLVGMASIKDILWAVTDRGD